MELRRFLGTLNFYRRCLPYAASVQAPMHAYLEGFCKIVQRIILWAPETEAAFPESKEELTNVAILAHSMPNAETCLVTDASDIAMGAAHE